MDYLDMNLWEVREALDKGKITSLELTQLCFKRIKATQNLNALISTCEATAIASAKAVDKARANGEKMGDLAGIPIVIKDLFNLTGTKTTCASKFLANYVSPYTATCVQKLIDAGAVIVGKANMDEFAMGSSNENSAFGIVRNPVNTEYVPGGSSGGSAASVASGQCFGALGTDTGGSIREPASFCGIVGLKPTYGRVSRYGAVAFASSLDHMGPLTRSVRDSAILLKAIAGQDEHDMTSSAESVPDYEKSITGSVKGLRIGVAKQFFNDKLNPEVRACLDNALSTYIANGAVKVDIDLPSVDTALAVYYILSSAEATSNLARFDGVKYGVQAKKYKDIVDLYFKSRTEGFGKEVKRRIMLGNYVLSSGYYDAFYRKAKRVQKVICQEFEKAFGKCDLILCPTTANPAFKIGEKSNDHLAMYLTDIFTVPINIAGLPAMSMPCGKNRQGLPVGLQLIAPHWKESTIFNAGDFLEKALKEGR